MGTCGQSGYGYIEYPPGAAPNSGLLEGYLLKVTPCIKYSVTPSVIAIVVLSMCKLIHSNNVLITFLWLSWVYSCQLSWNDSHTCRSKTFDLTSAYACQPICYPKHEHLAFTDRLDKHILISRKSIIPFIRWCEEKFVEEIILSQQPWILKGRLKQSGSPSAEKQISKQACKNGWGSGK